ncbi:MAG: hypothetical protein ABDI07_10610 [Candidatus Kryptonium sp.]
MPLSARYSSFNPSQVRFKQQYRYYNLRGNPSVSIPHRYDSNCKQIISHTSAFNITFSHQKVNTLIRKLCSSKTM